MLKTGVKENDARLIKSHHTNVPLQTGKRITKYEN